MHTDSLARRSLACLILLVLACAAPAQAGHRIEVELSDADVDSLRLAYYLLDKQYVSATAHASASGSFVFEGEDDLPPGMYLVVVPPDNAFFQILVGDAAQEFRVIASASDPVDTAVFEGSPDNEAFYAYMRLLADRGPRVEQLRATIEQTEDAAARVELESELLGLGQEVAAYQDSLISARPESFVAAVVRSNLPIDVPEFDGTDEERQFRTWRHYQRHVFDHVDLADPRLLRTPFLFERVTYFVDDLQVQHPDTLVRAIDRVLERMAPAEETFKTYLIHFLNKYAQSRIVGMDAVYVHLASNYYATGRAPWTEPEQLERIVENARRLEPLLIGRVAPDMALEDLEGRSVSLHGIEAEVVVLYFWREDCEPCTQSMPALDAFRDEYRDRGVEVVAVCTRRGEGVDGCWQYVDAEDVGDWIHLADPDTTVDFVQTYDVRSVPTVYVLDREKKIISKRIAVEQLGTVVDHALEVD